MFDIAKLLDECEIEFTGEQLEKLQEKLENEFFTTLNLWNKLFKKIVPPKGQIIL